MTLFTYARSRFHNFKRKCGNSLRSLKVHFGIRKLWLVNLTFNWLSWVQGPIIFLQTCLRFPKLTFKVPLRRKIVDLILNASEQYFHTSLNELFSFFLLRFFETYKLGVSDVIYSRIINYIYQMVNICVNSRQKFFKLCMTIAIW